MHDLRAGSVPHPNNQCTILLFTDTGTNHRAALNLSALGGLGDLNQEQLEHLANFIAMLYSSCEAERMAALAYLAGAPQPFSNASARIPAQPAALIAGLQTMAHRRAISQEQCAELVRRYLETIPDAAAGDDSMEYCLAQQAIAQGNINRLLSRDQTNFTAAFGQFRELGLGNGGVAGQASFALPSGAARASRAGVGQCAAVPTLAAVAASVGARALLGDDASQQAVAELQQRGVPGVGHSGGQAADAPVLTVVGAPVRARDADGSASSRVTAATMQQRVITGGGTGEQYRTATAVPASITLVGAAAGVAVL
jgi:hypothetical protein